ncbi:MAG: hypothetical protein MR332_05990 [Fusicatenibacter sp.]|nr:hypothetical protein [Fusicatenibacter sp.]
MKKIVCFIMSLLLLTGCGKEQTSSVKEEQPHEIAFTMNGEFEYAHGYDTLKDLAHGGNLVVYGEVQEYHCEALGHFIYTFEQVRVDEVLYGDCEAGDTINVRKMMGETTLAEHIESLKTCEPSLAEEYEEKYSKEEQETLYVRWENPYDIESEAGQKSIYIFPW